MPIRVLQIEGHPIFAEGLTARLSAQPDIIVVGSAATITEGLALAKVAKPHVALVGFHLPDGKGPDAARQLRELVPRIAVVFVSGDESDETLREAIGAGAVGFISKNEAAHKVVEAARRAASGETLVDQDQLRRILAQARVIAEEVPSLTEREQEILALIGEGLDNADIAKRLVISVHTVRHHVGNLLVKFDAHSKLELAAKAHRAGLLRGT
jgi:DNA-binding NarL/FixJ family response regulator